MHLSELLYFILFPFIPRCEYLRISSSEMNKSQLLWTSHLGLNIIDVKMNKLSKKTLIVEVEIQVGEVALFLYVIYGSE